MTFRVGERICCVDASDTHGLADLNELTRGAIYTVRDVLEFENAVCVRLEEILQRPFFMASNPSEPIDWCDWPFAARRFRPLVETKTDISCFTALLTPSRARERA